jgi:hypothetical protein
LRQPKHWQPFSLQDGSASDVVVGSGDNKQLPVGSIAGKRKFEHPEGNHTSINRAASLTAFTMAVKPTVDCTPAIRHRRGAACWPPRRAS